MTGNFAQGPNGTLAVQGDARITDTRGGATLGNLQIGGLLEITSSDGGITQQPGTVVVVGGTTTLDAGADAIRLDGPHNDFRGPFNASGSDVTVVDGTGGLVLGQIDAAGDFGATSTGGAITQAPGGRVTVGGITTLDAGSAAIVLDAPGNDFGGRVDARGGDITLVDGRGGLTLGRIVATGKLGVRSLGGDLVQATGTTITVAGRATLEAPTGAVRLAASGNRFAGGLVLPGAPGASDASAPPPLPPVVPPASLPGPLGAPPPLIDASATRGGVRLHVVPSGVDEGSATLVAGVPAGLLATGFSFVLPMELVPDATADDALRATVADGSPLPPWLRFEPAGRRFVAGAVPPGALPLRLVVTIGRQSRVVVLKAEGAEGAEGPERAEGL